MFGDEKKEIPRELREKIKQSLRESGKSQKFEEKLKAGMEKAFQLIQSGKTEQLVKNPFDNVERSELDALQSVFSYLQRKNLSYTLSTLLLETRVKQISNNKFDIQKVVAFTASQQADISNDSNDFPKDHDLETKSTPKQQDQIVDVDFDLNSTSSDSNFLEIEDDEAQDTKKQPEPKDQITSFNVCDSSDEFFDNDDDLLEEDPLKPTPNIQPKPKEPQKSTKNDELDFGLDDFEEIPDDYVPQGDEITRQEFDQNDIIVKLSDL